jgi:serine/threonine protein kinase
VTVYEFSDTGDVMFIAMEYIDGETLAQKMRDGALPVDFALAMTRAASEALDFAHAHHIVHRDVKPANFMISKGGHLKMADFGIAKILDAEVGLTSTGMVIGTAQYMSPEQIAAKEVTGRSDQFSLAVIAYEMLTGHRPFQGNSWASVMHSIISSEPPALSEYRKELGDEATQVLRKGLAKDPLQRYPSCRGMADALDHALLGPTAERPSYSTVIGKIPMAALTESITEVASRPKTSSNPERPLSVETETMRVYPPSATARPSSSAPTLAASPAASTPVTQSFTPLSGSSTVARMRRQWVVGVSVTALVVLGVGSWFVFRSNHQNAVHTPISSATGNIEPIPRPSEANTSQSSAQPASVLPATVQTPGSNASGNIEPIPQPSGANTSQPSAQPASVPAVGVTTPPRVAEGAQRDSARASRAKIAKAEPARATASPFRKRTESAASCRAASGYAFWGVNSLSSAKPARCYPGTRAETRGRGSGSSRGRGANEARCRRTGKANG